MIQVDVAIIGAGPVGLSTALFLVSQGVSVAVLEAAPALVEDMRASTFHPPTLDMLSVDGVADHLVATGHQVREWQYLRLDTGDAAVFDLAVVSDRTRHPYRLQCEQFHLTRAIVTRLAAHPLFHLHWGATLVRLDDRGADGVRVHTRGETDARQVQARYVVGADGAKSTVRKALGLEMAGATYPKTSITVVVDFPFERHLPQMRLVNYVWTPSGHYSLMRVGPYWRTGFSPDAGQSEGAAISAQNVSRHLGRITPLAANAPVVHVGAYTVQRRTVSRFRQGRVLLAGDAAHLNSPSGGLGMNSGIHDAHSLAAALVEALRGTGAGEAALDRYAEVRRQVALDDVQAQSDRNYRRHRETDPERREVIWAELKQITSDRARMRDYLLESSMIALVARSRAREALLA